MTCNHNTLVATGHTKGLYECNNIECGEEFQIE